MHCSMSWKDLVSTQASRHYSIVYATSALISNPGKFVCRLHVKLEVSPGTLTVMTPDGVHGLLTQHKSLGGLGAYLSSGEGVELVGIELDDEAVVGTLVGKLENDTVTTLPIVARTAESAFFLHRQSSARCNHLPSYAASYIVTLVSLTLRCEPLWTLRYLRLLRQQ
jgi:hypothetical protein